MNKILIKIYDSETENTYQFTDNNFKSIKFSNQLLDTSFDINPTVIEQYATIVFKDKDNKISDLVTAGKLRSDMEVQIYIDDELCFTYLTSSWTLQAQSTSVTLQCNDPSKKLENKQTDLKEPADVTLKELLDYAFSFSGYTYEFQDYKTQELTQNINIQSNYITYQDLLTLLKKLCVVGFLRIYWKKNRFIVARCL